MEKVLSNVKISKDLPDYILHVKDALAQQEVVAGVIKVLEDNKQVNSGVKLVTKHALLTVIMNAHTESSKKVIAKIIGVHVKNISSAILRCNVIDSTSDFLWSLYVKPKKSNGIFLIVKNVVQQWWASET
jgi:hypothetical protein